MALASQIMHEIPPLALHTTMREAAQLLSRGDIDVLAVVQDETQRNPAGVISIADVKACRAAGHHLSACPIERHLGRDFALAFPDDQVERTSTGRARGPSLRAVFVVGDDRRLQGIIPAGGGDLQVTPAHKIEPMIGGWGGMELVWRCGDCGHTVARPASPPDRCPGCGAPREHFVLLIED